MKNRLEELRKERGINQEELAAVLEVSRQTIGLSGKWTLQSIYPSCF